MYRIKKLSIFIRILALLTGLLTATGVGAATPLFDANCAASCHGEGNAGTNIEGVVIPPVQDTSFAGIKNSITPVPVPGHEIVNVLYGLEGSGITDESLAAISAELNPPSGCIPPQELVNGICAVPTTPSCTAPLVLVNGVCTNPTEPNPNPTPSFTACDDRANKSLCVNQIHQFGSLGSEETTAAKADIYKVSCPNPAVGVSASVSGLTADNSSWVSIQVFKGGAYTPVIVDNTPGDGIASLRSAKLTKGPGVYNVKVNKMKLNSVPGIVQYDATIRCLSNSGRKVIGRVVIQNNQ